MAFMSDFEAAKAKRNREMVARTAHREGYVDSRASDDELTPERIAHLWTERMRELASSRLNMSPQTIAALRARGLGGLVPDAEEAEVRALAVHWLAEEQAEAERAALDRQMKETHRQERMATQGPRMTPQVPGMPAGLTERKALLLDLYLVHGASQPEIAALLTISQSTVKNTLYEAFALLEAHGRREAAAAWRQWQAAQGAASRQSGYTPDALLTQRLALLRGTAPLSYEPYTLTVQQRRVLLLLVEGLSQAQMALRMQLSPRTVAHHLTALYRAMGVRSAAAAVTRYQAECVAEEAADVV